MQKVDLQAHKKHIIVFFVRFFSCMKKVIIFLIGVV